MMLLRAFFLQHRALAGAVIALALLVKALVPGGMMPGAEAKVLTLRVCIDMPLAPAIAHDELRAIVVPTKDGETARHAKAEAMCPYAALAVPGLGAVDPVQLALALAFIVLCGLAAQSVPAPLRAVRLRPPLRGPPARA